MSNNNIRILSQPISYQELMSINKPKIVGIYKIENIVNHKVYIGQSTNIIKRCKDHMKYEINPHLLRAFKDYGYDNFSFEVIKETYDLNYWEIFLIQLYDSTNPKYGYNIAIGGQGGNLGPEVNKKISEKLKIICSNPEYRKQHSEIKSKWWREVGLTEEQRKQWSEIQKGKVLSEEHKKHISEGLIGRIVTDEEKLHHSIALKGRELSEEHKRHISEAKSGQEAYNKGMKWFNNGEKNIMTNNPPEGFVPGVINKNCLSNEEKQLRLERIKNNELEAEKQKELRIKKKEIKETSDSYHWYNNGSKSIKAKECPKGFVPGRIGNFTQSEEAKQKKRDWYNNLTEEQRKEYKQHLSESHIGHHFTVEEKKKIGEKNKGRKYFNNGIEEVMRFECPPGFVPGRLEKNKIKISQTMKIIKKHQDSNINNNKE